jgi:RNA polymerase sigma-70 factor (ECF subfamily)
MSLLATLQQVFAAADHPLADPAAFSGFYEQHYPSVFRYIYMLHGGSHNDAEDLTAEAFIRAWSQRQRFRGSVEAALGWMLTIARRLVIDHRRRQQHRQTSALEESTAADQTANPEQHALLRERERLALTLLNRTSLEQRNMLILRYFFGWRVRDIAQHLGASEGAISVSIHRTLASLRVHGIQLTAQETNDAY